MQRKSLGLAVVLTFFFGPLGLFYATLSGGLIMCLTPIVLVGILIFGTLAESEFLVFSSFFLMMIFAISYWVICVIWAVAAVNSHNGEVDEREREAELIRYMTYPKASDAAPQFSNNTIHIHTQESPKIPYKPTLQEWRRNNPNGSINDYYRIHGGG